MEDPRGSTNALLSKLISFWQQQIILIEFLEPGESAFPFIKLILIFDSEGHAHYLTVFTELDLLHFRMIETLGHRGRVFGFDYSHPTCIN